MTGFRDYIQPFTIHGPITEQHTCPVAHEPTRKDRLTEWGVNKCLKFHDGDDWNEICLILLIVRGLIIWQLDR